MTPIIGIDPGLTGAIAVYYDGRYRSLPELAVWDMPLNYDGNRQVLDAAELWNLLDREWPRHAEVVIERVGPMPRQSAHSAFSFGRTFGVLLGVFAESDLVLVTPQIWKAALGLTAKPGTDARTRKNASRALAQKIFPDYAHLFARAKDDGRAEAALIAYYGAMKLREAAP